MKKLLVAAMGATAAFGAFAYTNAVRFEGEAGDKTAAELNALAQSWNETATGTYVAAPADTAGTNQYAIAALTGNLPVARPLMGSGEVFQANPTNELSVKTQFGKPLEFYVDPANTSNGQSIGNGLYFDSLVKFTVCDGDPEQDYTDAKIVMWLQTNEAETQTNLMVKAGYLSKVNGNVEVEPTVYTCNAVGGDFADKWHRVTIKAIADITANEGGVPAFAIYIDGGDTSNIKEVATTANRLDGSFDYTLTEAADFLNRNKMLFPSLKQGTDAGTTKLSCVAFDGTGWLNDLVVTDQLPGEFARDHEANKAKVKIGDQGLEVPYESLEEMLDVVNTALADGSSVSVTLLKGMTIATPLEFTGSGTLTFDFAGVVLTNENSYAAITNSAATLIITNSSETLGGIYCTDGDALATVGGSTTINGGMFNGIVTRVTPPGTLSINGGYFSQSLLPLKNYLAGGKTVKFDTTTGLNKVQDIVYYRVTFDADGGVWTGAEYVDVEEGKTVTAPNVEPTKANYTFVKWRYNNGEQMVEFYFKGSETPTQVAANMTLVAQWAEVIPEYTVTFRTNGVVFATQNVTSNSTASAPSPAPTAATGYTFDDWYEGDSAVAYDFATPVTGNLTLDAKFTADTYTVTYNLDLVGATNAVDNIASYTIETAEFTLLDAGCEGYTFNGWTNTSGTVTAIAGGTTGDVTLYATWTQQSSDPIPPVSPEADSATVNAAVDEAGFTDSAVKALINGDATKYNSFKSWADSVSGGEKAVVNSAHAAVSFQLSPIVQSATLFENTPVLKFTKIEPTASSTSWDVTVELKDGEDKTVQLKAAAADFATRVWKGSSLSNMTQCSASDVTAAVQDADGKKVTLTVTPPSGTSGFIKIKAE